MKKTIIIMIILNILFAIGVILYITKDDRVTYENVKGVSSALAIMVYDESVGDYVKQDTVPKGEYSINTVKTHCVANGEIKAYDNTDGTITYSISSGDECYVYFDVKPGPDGSVLVIAPDDNLAEAIVAKGTNNLMSSDNTWGLINENGYRYEGEDPSNYICFGSDETTCPADNVYRIIGAFNVEYDNNGDGAAETTGYLAKVQKNTIYGSSEIAYHSTYLGTTINSHYPNSEIYPILNTTWYGDLSSDYQNQIASVNWNLGAIQSPLSSLTAADYYTQERGTTVNTGITEYEKVFKVGMMYPSDYGYAVLSGNCARTTALYNYADVGLENCFDLNWMYDTRVNQWTMTPYISSDGNSWVMYVYCFTYGYTDVMPVDSNAVVNPEAVRPVFYLNPNVIVTGGTGTSSDPYRISL